MLATGLFVDTDDTHKTTTQDVRDINLLLGAFDLIGLNDLGATNLQNRVDTKYVFGISQLYSILQHIVNDYWVVDINGVRLNHYRTLYFDTVDFTMYHDHHNKIGTRYKIRARQYVDSDLAFLEIKQKNNQKRTIKTRVEIDDIAPHITQAADTFIASHSPFEVGNLEPKVWNEYSRLTLVSKTHAERVTIDVNLAFSVDDCTVPLTGVVIAEVKQSRASRDSEVVRALRKCHIRPMSFSKYAAGIYTFYDGVKINNFKSQIHHINKIMLKELGL